MEIYKSEFLQILSFQEHRLVEIIWLSETEKITVEEYKSEFINLLNALEKSNHNKVLVDERELLFAVIPELQEWVNQNIFTKLPVANLAIILSEDMIIQLAAEQLLDEEIAKNVTHSTRFFNNKETALDWLKNM